MIDNEIKTYDKSPDNLLGIEDETVQYKWKFKIDSDFQVSPSFTHLHQLKPVGGSLENMPMYTLTARKGSPDQLELRYAETDTQITLQQTDLTPFKGIWLEVTETINYGTSGTYSIVITKVSDGTTLFDYTNNSIINWRSGANFVRPKWGIYRSLINVADLRDEEVLFANFSIEEIGPLSLTESKLVNNDIKLVPNPSNGIVLIEEAHSNSFDSINLYDNSGRFIRHLNSSMNNSIDLTNFNTGLYFVAFKKGNSTIHIQKLLIK